VGKLSSDWLRGDAVRGWLAARTDVPLIGGFLTDDWLVYTLVYGSLLLNLLAPFLLLWKRTRLGLLIAVTIFHVINARLFGIAPFPWLIFAATLLFFPPDWPRLRRLRRRDHTETPPSESLIRRFRRHAPRTVSLIAVYFLIQLLVPLRHHLYPGNVNWTSEGHNFSWLMDLHDKTGRASFIAKDPATGEQWEVDARDYLAARQHRKMVTRPRMIAKFARHLESESRLEGYEDVVVTADVLVSRNGSTPQPIVDPTADLTEVNLSPMLADWILPMDEHNR
jgi:hypothetical protein